MNTVRRMEGTPWHVEYMRREEGDARRDRRRCIKFRKEGSYCSIYFGKCIGSAHCPYYNAANNYSKRGQGAREYTSIQQDFPFMSRVHHKRYGNGIVAGNQKGQILVAFAKKTKSFSVEECIQNGLLRRA